MCDRVKPNLRSRSALSTLHLLHNSHVVLTPSREKFSELLKETSYRFKIFGRSSRGKATIIPFPEFGEERHTNQRSAQRGSPCLRQSPTIEQRQQDVKISSGGNKPCAPRRDSQQPLLFQSS